MCEWKTAESVNECCNQFMLHWISDLECCQLDFFLSFFFFFLFFYCCIPIYPLNYTQIINDHFGRLLFSFLTPFTSLIHSLSIRAHKPYSLTDFRLSSKKKQTKKKIIIIIILKYKTNVCRNWSEEVDGRFPTKDSKKVMRLSYI